jgi:hypothetical protein
MKLTRHTLSVALGALALATVSTLVACGGGSESSGDGDLLDDGTGTGTVAPVTVATDGGTVSADGVEGTPCTEPGSYVSCHAQIVTIDGFKDCSGNRTCDADSGTWGTCVSTLVISGGDAG